MPTAAQVRSLMRQYLRLGRTFPNYNIRSYLDRKGREDARRWASGPPADAAAPAAEAAWRAAVDDLAAFKRQAAVYGMYGRKFKTVLELEHDAAAKAKAG
ncbi:hypothetical protein Rsub_11827 [Raphidocelis subcapitata]|uniref:Complex 1 LYR protein domain-containing protein n=1 Tax=Raphidocelis subcapitata TaxID=307507 RepID=A0A2V0PLS6_9CHLO|nr:hypothetical protein Rsub_11827 [Raphidocelis subcapitata]|eukprot:GBF99023.1 hypothetical protein Rsub_11827 [Raphidocelis subcapitata]